MVMVTHALYDAILFIARAIKSEQIGQWQGRTIHIWPPYGKLLQARYLSSTLYPSGQLPYMIA